jgi:hypothetical protein
MKIRHAIRGANALAALLSIGCTTTAHATSSSVQTAPQALQRAADQVTVPLTDPSKPAAIHVSLVHGGITVRGTNRRDVLVITRPDADPISHRFDPDATGLRRLPQTAGFRVTEENNRVTVSGDNPSRAMGFDIEVPRRANLVLKTVNGGDILVENVEGDLDVHNTNGGITLNSVAGSVTAVTTNGSVRATLTQVAAQKDMAFTSLNGNVDVTLPPSTKANLRLRSDHGDVYSDFDVQLQPQPQPAPTVQENTRGDGRYRINRTRSVIGTINGGGPEFELRTFNSNVYIRKGSNQR